MSIAIKWASRIEIPPRAYVCGYCGKEVGPNAGYLGEARERDTGNQKPRVYLYVCSRCNQPTFFDVDGHQWPGAAFGAEVQELPDGVRDLYGEARRAMSVSAPNVAVMACGKILMNVAVQEGAKKNQSFQYYVEWLVENHYVPPKGEGWIDHIRLARNDANHEIELIAEEQARQILSFTELFLKFVYEMPARVGAAEPAHAEPAE